MLVKKEYCKSIYGGHMADCIVYSFKHKTEADYFCSKLYKDNLYLGHNRVFNTVFVYYKEK